LPGLLLLLPPQVQDILSLANELGFTCIKAYKMDASRAVQQPGREEQQQETQQHQGASQEQQRRQEEEQQQAEPERGQEAHGQGEGQQGGPKLSPRQIKRQQRTIRALQQRGLPLPAHVADPTSAKGPTLASPFPPASFDYVLCDAPCTALGQRPRLTQVSQQWLPTQLPLVAIPCTWPAAAC
jgi:hypothetical protein